MSYFENALKKGFIVDPSLFSRLESMQFILFLKKEYNSGTVVLPSSLFFAAKEGDYERIAFIIKKWQWMLPLVEIRETIESPDFKKLIRNILEFSSPASKFGELEEDPTIAHEIALELREIATRLGLPIVSRSRSFITWLRKESVAVFELVEEHYKTFKRDFRKKYRESLRKRLGVRAGQAGLNIFIASVALTQQAVLPPPWNLILAVAVPLLVDKLYVAVVIDPKI